MAKRNRHAKTGIGVNDPLDHIHMGEEKRIRLEEIPLEDANGDLQVGNRAYNDARYQFKGQSTNNQAIFLEGGYWIWSGNGLNMIAVRTVYLLPGYDSPFTVEATNLPLDPADATNPRFDRPVWDDQGTVSVLKGTPAAEPIVPSVTDPLTQIAGNEISIPAAATEPETPGGSSFQLITIYNENLGEPNEYTPSFIGAGTANFAATTDPNKDSIHASLINLQNADFALFTNDVDFDLTTIDVIKMDIKLLASMGAGHSILISFLDDTDKPISLLKALNLNKSNTANYQVVSIPIGEFTFSQTNARKVRLYWRRQRGATVHPGFLLDNLQFQTGIVPPVIAGDIELEGHVIGSGKTGEPIDTTITEKAISDQTQQTDPLPSTAEALFRLNTGALVRVPASLLFSAGTPGADGADGREVEIQNNGTHIQWRYVDSPILPWTDLVALSAITGPAGANGADGREAEFQVSGTNLQWRLVGDPIWITIFDLSTLGGGGSGLPVGGTTGQFLAKASNTDGDAEWVNPPAGGGGATRVAFSTAIDPTGNFFSEHNQTGPIAYTLGAGLNAATQFGNKTEHYIEANGTGGKPTFSTAFVIQMDTWSNNTGDVNCLIFKVSKTGKILVWLDNIEVA